MNHQPVAIITGGSSGIGLATAHKLIELNYRLVLSARSPERLDAARQTLIEHGAAQDAVVTQPCDMGDLSQASALVDAAIRAFERLDVLFNNAGVAPREPIAEHTDALIRETFMVNTVGPALAIVDAWKQFAAQRERGDNGRYVIVNTSSRATWDPFPGFLAYAASKAAVELMAKSVANEGGELGVVAFSIAPGAVETPLLRDAFTTDELPTAATMRPDEVADMVLKMIGGEMDQHDGKTVYITRKEGGGVETWMK